MRESAAERVNTSTSLRSALIFSLIHTEALFFIHHQQSELVEDGVLAQQLVGAHHRIDRAILQTSKIALRSLAVRNRLSSATLIG